MVIFTLSDNGPNIFYRYTDHQWTPMKNPIIENESLIFKRDSLKVFETTKPYFLQTYLLYNQKITES